VDSDFNHLLIIFGKIRERNEGFVKELKCGYELALLAMVEESAI
jgi:hypothetical protein